MKKFLSLLLALTMLLCCLPAMAEADGFPELDSIAAWDYIGDWFGVSGLDVMGDPISDYPEFKLCLYLNGLGDLYLDGGDKEIVGWYIEDGYVFLARTADGVPNADEIFAFACKDETGRLVVDLMTVSVRCEQEGEEYLDVTWPEFDAEDAKYFIGTWEAVTYISEGVEVSAELAGPMTIVLKDDGTAQSLEGEGEPYELRWYSDYAVAYLGENPLELVEITFDGNGNISVKMDEENTVIMAPVAEVIETGTILGTWESSDRTVEITEDGKLKMVYKSDGYTNHMQWEIIDGMPTVSLGTWKGSTIQFVDGYLIINYSVEQKLTRVGDVPEIYVGPGGFEVPADDSSAAFLGNWVEDDGRGVLTFNADFTAVMNFTDGRVYDMNWKTTDEGAMFTSGNWFDTPMVIEDENTLNIGDGWMILYREGTQDSGDEMPVAQPIGAEGEAYFGTWTMDLGGMAMNLTLNQDGTCAMEMMGESEPGVWTMENGKAYVMGDECQIDGDGNLVVESAGMVFVKMEDASSGNEEMSEEEALLAFLAMLGQMEGGEEGSLAPEAPVDYIPATMDDYIGGWICADDDSVQMLLLEGEATLIEDGVGYPAAWSVEDGIAIIDGMKLYTQEDWSGIMDMDGELIKFERGYVEKPKASAAAADTGDDEMTDEELLAFLALLGQMEGGEGSSELPEALQPYVGTWHMVYLATGGFEGDMRAAGLTGKLELTADGNGKLSGIADDSGKWYDDEGTVRFGKADTPLVLMDGGFLRYGSQLAGFMVFSQDPNAVWSPAPAATEVPAPTAAPVVSQGEKKGFSSLEERLDKKFICTSYVATYGGRQDASTLGAEYSLTFYSDGKLEFVMQGVPVTNLSWALKDIPRGLGTVQAFSFNYAMTDFNAVITDTGFEMDFYGSMLMTFELAE